MGLDVSLSVTVHKEAVIAGAGVFDGYREVSPFAGENSSTAIARGMF